MSQSDPHEPDTESVDTSADEPMFSRGFARRARAVVYLILLLAIAIMWSTFDNAADPDLWHRLATGKIVWEEGAVPMQDRFSFNGKGGIVEDHEWLTGVLFYPLYTAFGQDAFVWVKIVLFGLILFTVAPPRRYRHGRPHQVAWTWEPAPGSLLHRARSTLFYGEPDFSVVSLSFTCVVAFGLLPDICSTIRCHGFTMVFWAAWIVWLEQARRTGRLPWVAVIITSALWMNMHGGYIAGLGLLFIYALGQLLNGERWVAYAALGSASALATLLNPYGTGMWISTVNAIFIPHPEFKSWHPPVLTDLSNPGFKILLLMSIPALIPQILKLRLPSLRLVGRALQGERGERSPVGKGAASGGGDWVPVLIMLIAGAMALKQQRNGGLFVICAAIFAWPWLCELSRRAAPWWRSARHTVGTSLWVKARNIAAGCSLLFIGAMLMAAASGNQFGLWLRPNHAPQAVLFLEQEQLKQHAAQPSSGQPPATAATSERLLVPFNWGSYALWKLYPRVLVSMDGRYELVYTIDRYLQNEGFFRARGDWRRFLEESRATMILSPIKAPVTTQLRTDPAWPILHEDADAVIFIHKPVATDAPVTVPATVPAQP